MNYLSSEQERECISKFLNGIVQRYGLFIHCFDILCSSIFTPAAKHVSLHFARKHIFWRLSVIPGRYIMQEASTKFNNRLDTKLFCVVRKMSSSVEHVRLSKFIVNLFQRTRMWYVLDSVIENCGLFMTTICK